MKRVLLFAVAIGFAGTWVGTTPVFGGQGNGPGNSKSAAIYPVCHQIGTGGWQLIYVSEDGLDNHLNGSHAGFDFEYFGRACDLGPGDGPVE